MALQAHGNKLNREVSRQKKAEQKTGRRERVIVRTSQYVWSERKMECRRLRRVLKSSGPKAGRSYAQAHGLMEELRRIAEKNGLMGRRAKQALDDE